MRAWQVDARRKDVQTLGAVGTGKKPCAPSCVMAFRVRSKYCGRTLPVASCAAPKRIRYTRVRSLTILGSFAGVIDSSEIVLLVRGHGTLMSSRRARVDLHRTSLERGPSRMKARALLEAIRRRLAMLEVLSQHDGSRCDNSECAFCIELVQSARSESLVRSRFSRLRGWISHARVRDDTATTVCGSCSPGLNHRQHTQGHDFEVRESVPV